MHLHLTVFSFSPSFFSNASSSNPASSSSRRYLLLAPSSPNVLLFLQLFIACHIVQKAHTVIVIDIGVVAVCAKRGGEHRGSDIPSYPRSLPVSALLLLRKPMDKLFRRKRDVQYINRGGGIQAECCQHARKYTSYRNVMFTQQHMCEAVMLAAVFVQTSRSGGFFLAHRPTVHGGSLKHRRKQAKHTHAHLFAFFNSFRSFFLTPFLSLTHTWLSRPLNERTDEWATHRRNPKLLSSQAGKKDSPLPTN